MFTEKINDLIEEMLSNGLSPEGIIWQFSSRVTKQCDIEYKINRSLTTSRKEEDSDNPLGDSSHTNITKVELDTQLDQYINHDRNCGCFLASECVICTEDVCDTKLNCCNNWFHNHCLLRWHGRSETCPICRAKIIITGDTVKSLKNRNIAAKNNNYSVSVVSNIQLPPPIISNDSSGSYNPSYSISNRLRRPNTSPTSSQIRYSPFLNESGMVPTVRPPPPPRSYSVSERGQQSNEREAIDVIPTEDPDVYKEMTQNFVIRRLPDSSLVVLGVFLNDANDIRNLTNEEKEFALRMGLDTCSSTSLNNEETKHRCIYVFRRGPFQGRQCKSRPELDGYCNNHYR